MTAGWRRETVDSVVLGATVLTLTDIDGDTDLCGLEDSYMEAEDPSYVVCKVVFEDFATRRNLSSNGFELLELQYRISKALRTDADTSRFDYSCRIIQARDELDSILDIASRTIEHDRFSIDWLLDQGMSGERYRQYVLESYSRSDEYVWALFDNTTSELVAFRTYRKLSDQAALLLLGGVSPLLKNLGLGVVSSNYFFNFLRQEGINRVTSHIAATNYPVVNLEVSFLGFRVNQAYAVMRKGYFK